MIGELFTPLQFGMPGGMELAVILLIAVLLFGANKIPKLARATGQAMGEFQRGREEIEQELEEIQEGGSQSETTEAADTGSQTDATTDDLSQEATTETEASESADTETATDTADADDEDTT
ncbi:MAG: twin-arginine translocase TatA/TatE family subunit [Halobacteriales archaeon]